MRYALLLGAVVMVAAAASLLQSPGDSDAPAAPAAKPQPAPVRPTRPPVAGQDRPRPTLDEPGPPVPTEEMREVMAEKARGAERPGQVAFRTFSDLYVDANLDFARRQAESEGITVPEVRELTHFGLLVLATQRVPDVEEVLGQPLSQEQRDSLASLMNSANSDFKSQVRQLVADGAGEAERWKLIRATQARYLDAFYRATGMNEALLDDLLAGNMLLPGAPINTEPPDGPVSPADPRDDDLHPQRPR
jgi:hypothetical protein